MAFCEPRDFLVIKVISASNDFKRWHIFYHKIQPRIFLYTVILIFFLYLTNISPKTNRKTKQQTDNSQQKNRRQRDSMRKHKDVSKKVAVSRHNVPKGTQGGLLMTGLALGCRAGNHGYLKILMG